MIPSFELKTQYQQVKAEILVALERVLDSGAFILGNEVRDFEKEFVAWNESSHGCGVGSGTEALHLALRALHVGAGDEVIVPTFTYIATASAVSMCNARPVFVDVEPETFTLNVEQVAAAVTPRTKAIIAVHLYGHPANMSALREIADRHKLALIEDCAQATGARWQGTRVGNLSDYGCFSFFPTKNLGAYGDGGFVTARTHELEQRIRCLRTQGQGERKYYHHVIGTNSRLDEMQAAVLRVKLRYLDKWNRERRSVAQRYIQGIQVAGIKMPLEQAGCEHVYHQFTVTAENRQRLQDSLTQQGVGCTVYYPLSVHLQEAYAHCGQREGSLPVAERLQDQVLSLPMYPEMSDDQIERVIQAVTSSVASV